MSIETFRNALKYEEMITIGGGEPTLHPQFWQIIGEALGHSEDVWLATNGSQTQTSLTLASLAKRGVLGVALSLDEFHDPIDPKVIEAFRKTGIRDNDRREIRNTSEHLIKAGRCKDGKEGCICEDIMIKPDGTVKGCGCKDAIVLGDINDENFEMPTEWEYGNCSKNQPDPIEKGILYSPSIFPMPLNQRGVEHERARNI